jgi:hypothetical protein
MGRWVRRIGLGVPWRGKKPRAKKRKREKRKGKSPPHAPLGLGSCLPDAVPVAHARTQASFALARGATEGWRLAAGRASRAARRRTRNVKVNFYPVFACLACLLLLLLLPYVVHYFVRAAGNGQMVRSEMRYVYFVFCIYSQSRVTRAAKHRISSISPLPLPPRTKCGAPATAKAVP